MVSMRIWEVHELLKGFLLCNTQTPFLSFINSVLVCILLLYFVVRSIGWYLITQLIYGNDADQLAYCLNKEQMTKVSWILELSRGVGNELGIHDIHFQVKLGTALPRDALSLVTYNKYLMFVSFDDVVYYFSEFILSLLTLF